MQFFLYNLIVCFAFAILSCVSEVTIRNVTAGGGIFLESPQWSVKENALYWVDDFDKKIYRMDWETSVTQVRKVEDRSRHPAMLVDISFPHDENFVMTEKDMLTKNGPTTMIKQVKEYPRYFVVAIHTGLYLMHWEENEENLVFKLFATVDSDKPANNIADGSIDAQGRLVFGTFGSLKLDSKFFVEVDQATLYSVEIDAQHKVNLKVQKQPVSLSTGVAWSLDNKKMYYIDCSTRKVTVFDYDLEKGTIANETVLFDFAVEGVNGAPDGMTRDVNGNLWIATYDGQTVVQIDPISRRLLRKIELPVDQVSSLTWGGPALDILYATTGAIGVKKPMPLSGSLIEISGLETKGIPEHQFSFPNAPTY